MRKLITVLLISLALSSCEKKYILSEGYILPEEEIPGWLIPELERFMSSPDYEKNDAAWSRYTWDNEYYYQYFCLSSSTIPSPISHAGDTLDFRVNDSSRDYYKEKCCHKYVWVGPLFRKIYSRK